MNRRDFLKNAGKISAAAALLPTIIPASAFSANNNVLPGNRINIGFIGLGNQGSGLLRGFLNSPDLQVVAICDVIDANLQKAKDSVLKYYGDKQPDGTYKGLDTYKDFRKIIDRKDIDAVVIATPDHWHAVQTIMAARAGKDIYCEKPLSLTINEARVMVNQVRRYDRVFQTGSMQRSDNKFRFACELVQNGYIGDVKHIRVSIRTGFKNHPLVCELPAEPVPSELDWEMWLGPAPVRPYNRILAYPLQKNGYPDWRNYRDYSGGGMTDWGAHHFDIAQWGMGMDHSGPVEIIPPDGKKYKYLTYIYENGTEMQADFEDNLIRFTGTKGVVEVNRQYIKTTPESLVTQKILPNEIHLYNSTDHRNDFINSIRTRTKPITDIEIGCRSVTVCHLGNIAVQLNQALKWDPVKEEFKGNELANRLRERAKHSPWTI